LADNEDTVQLGHRRRTGGRAIGSGVQPAGQTVGAIGGDRRGPAADIDAEQAGSTWRISRSTGSAESTWCFSMPASSTIGTNVYGLLNGIKVFLPILMNQAEGGSLLATSSAAGVHGTSYHTAEYAATKNAQLTIMECLYGQLRDAGSGIHVGVVLPPLVRTNLAGDDPSILAQVGPASIVEPAEFAEVVVEGLLDRSFWIETTEEQSHRLYGGRSADNVKRNAKRVQTKADAMINHEPPDQYLW
jgi:hypothetical protein